ncbi:cell growth-regulating nucleolar protein [Cylas formicarius]|uniref:cell growth-regulating nucleolar protein n=1 Tax=Cylas formicarius TaxID=197179 RepID=UPI00295898C1|nr:cell growth-regulating nucleolar protein [Cylas formicarius]
MVVFTCNNCGETLHKPKVEKHYTFVCRTRKSLTCVDCLKDFVGEEFLSHTKCITEEERYAAKGTYKNGIVKKGEAKQESWVDMIRSICEREPNLSPAVKSIFNTLSNYSNVPRKKNKFVNFMQNSSGKRISIVDIGTVWNIIEKYNTKNVSNEKLGEQNGQPCETKKRAAQEIDNPSKKKKIEVEQSQNDFEKLDEEIAVEKFSFKQTILDLLNAKGTMSQKKLEKKVLKVYIKEMGEVRAKENIVKKISKKLKKIPNLYIEDDIVTLQSS